MEHSNKYCIDSATQGRADWGAWGGARQLIKRQPQDLPTVFCGALFCFLVTMVGSIGQNPPPPNRRCFGTSLVQQLI